MNIQKKPDWLKIRLSTNEAYREVKKIVGEHRLHTICQSGDCPNMCECWGRGTATFMVLGNICTRACKFCNVNTGKPLPPDMDEPARLAQSIKLMKLRHAVITSVDRDDLPDFGASFWATTIGKIKEINTSTTIEVLVPDFQGRTELMDLVIKSGPQIIAHNLETVRSLTPKIRTKAEYKTSLKMIEHISKSGVHSKSGIMLGLGEKESEIIETIDDLSGTGCQILTIGQYLQPTKNNHPVMEYISPEKFAAYRTIALKKGFRFVESAPLVRSSYHAEQHIQ